MLETSDNNSFKKLDVLRNALLMLHSELLDLEKQRYEDVHGKIKTASELYSLVTKDPSFQWLRELSTLIVSIDDLTEATDKIGRKQSSSLVKYVRALLSPDKASKDFPGKYYYALQKKPSIVVVHGRVVRALKSMEENSPR